MFAFYDDGSEENALADSRKYAPAYDDGAVLLGRNFSRSLLGVGETAITVILAHEWCHIQQFKAQKKFSWDVRYELDADEGAGRYFRSRTDDEALAEKAALLFFGIGDNAFTLPEHHGTPNQRSDVFRSGFGLETGIARRGPAEKK